MINECEKDLKDYLSGRKRLFKKKNKSGGSAEEKRNSIGEIQLAYVYAQCSCASVPYVSYTSSAVSGELVNTASRT